MAANFLGGLPAPLSQVLSDGGIKVSIGDRLTTINPALKGQHPRGWPRGATWDSVTGVFSPGRDEIAVAETFRPIGQKIFEARTAEELRGTLAHETGHGIDRALGKIAGEYYESRNPDFVKAYKADAKGARAAKRARPLSFKYDYYLQKGDAGPSEAFAEIVGEILNGSRYGRPMETMFPNSWEYINDLLQRLGV